VPSLLGNTRAELEGSGTLGYLDESKVGTSSMYLPNKCSLISISCDGVKETLQYEKQKTHVYQILCSTNAYL